jgi:hypothetical protein
MWKFCDFYICIKKLKWTTYIFEYILKENWTIDVSSQGQTRNIIEQIKKNFVHKAEVTTLRINNFYQKQKLDRAVLEHKTFYRIKSKIF